MILPEFPSPEFAERSHPKKREPHFLLEIWLEWRGDPDHAISRRVHERGHTWKIGKIEQFEKAVNIPTGRWFVRFGLGDAPSEFGMFLVKLSNDPIHLRTVRRRFLGNHDVAPPGQQTAKALQHSLATTDYFRANRCIGLIEPSGQT